MSHVGTGRRVLTAATAALLLGGFASAHADLTTPACLAKKLRAWGNLRRCQDIENGEALQGRESHLPACQTTFNNSLAKIDAQANAAAIACRYGDNGDGTATDYDTGLQWEQKTSDGTVHDASNTYAWSLTPMSLTFGPPDGSAFGIFLGTLNNGTTAYFDRPTTGCFAGHCDWRLPLLEELKGIGSASAFWVCPDQTIFGPTGDAGCAYWSATTDANNPDAAWLPNEGLSRSWQEHPRGRSGCAVGPVIDSSISTAH
jgi:hypothetical protein